MKKIIVSGSSGLVGSKLVASLRDRYQIIPWTSSTDITDAGAVEAAIAQAGGAEAMVHLAAYTNVNGAFEQTDDKTGPAWRINVDGTDNIARACAQHGIYLIHLSTAFVFDGQKTDPYVETDTPSPIEWYGRTKYEAEKVVLREQVQKSASVILRIDQPFSTTPFKKVDTLWRIINGLQENSLYPQFTNHFFGPTYIEDLIKSIDFALRAQPVGVYHASNGESWTDYDFALAVKEILQLPGEVKAGDLETYLRSSARPYQRNTALNCERWRSVSDFAPRSIREAIGKVEME